MAENAPIIFIKRKSGHSGHHGGAWKVAYADFVTAMMALFIVLWLLNTSKQVQEAVGGYFKDPTGKSKMVGNGGPQNGTGTTVVTAENMNQLKDALQKAIEKVTNFDKLKNQIEMTVTPEGLRIELLESATGTFFDLGSPNPNQNGKELLMKLAEELGKLPNPISIEGHTDSKPFASRGDYTNWELSADRANSARRLMESSGLAPEQVVEIRGFADQRLRKPDNPLDPANRRISVIVKYLKKDDGAAGKLQAASPVLATSAP
jgi:chemotaxis protein MotB